MRDVADEIDESLFKIRLAIFGFHRSVVWVRWPLKLACFPIDWILSSHAFSFNFAYRLG